MTILICIMGTAYRKPSERLESLKFNTSFSPKVSTLDIHFYLYFTIFTTKEPSQLAENWNLNFICNNNAVECDAI